MADSRSGLPRARTRWRSPTHSLAESRPDLATFPPLRAWQRRALVEYLRRRDEDFLAVATPGAGKTTFALRIAAELLAEGAVEAVTVVTPTEHLKSQWAQAAAAVGIPLDSTFRNADRHTTADFRGAVVTYAQVGTAPMVHRRRSMARRTLVVLDEVHHAGDSRSWGDGVRSAFEPAVRRLMLTGTPFRSDENPIPFVTYVRGPDGLLRSRSDSSYGYGDALADGVVRPVIFLAYSGQTRWRTSAGEELTVRLGEPVTQDVTAAAWRTALDPSGDWMPQVLRAADARLQVLRAADIPDAGGLVIATDQKSARAYARLLTDIAGEKPVVVLSDDAGASNKIAGFAASTQRWLVAVRMVSEGVDIPRLSVGVYATSACTPLFFAQAIGRFVRVRRPGETASVFLPSVSNLLGLASEMEAERDHVLGIRKAGSGFDDELLERAQQSERASDELTKSFEALSATAELDQVIFDGTSFGMPVRTGTPEEEEYLGLPGLLTPDQVALLLHRRQAEQSARGRRSDASKRDIGGRVTCADRRGPTGRSASPAQRSRGSSPPSNRHPPRKDPRGVASTVRGTSERAGHHRAARSANHSAAGSLTLDCGGTQWAPRISGRPSNVYVGRSALEQTGVLREFGAAPLEIGRSDHLNRDLHELRRELVRVVPAEDQFATARKHDTQLAGRVAAVAALFGCGGCRGLRRWREGWGHRLLLCSWVHGRCLLRHVFHLSYNIGSTDRVPGRGGDRGHIEPIPPSRLDSPAVAPSERRQRSQLDDADPHGSGLTAIQTRPAQIAHRAWSGTLRLHVRQCARRQALVRAD